MIDGILALGVLTTVCGLVGYFDDQGDSVVLVACGVPAIGIGLASRRGLERSHRPAPSRVLAGLAMTWLVLVLAGAGIYLGTGTIDRVDSALVESAAGFSTTALTTLDPSQLSVPMQLWRASTQWVGGLVGILAGVVALPMALRGSSLAPGESAAARLVASPSSARRRVLAIYSSLTLLCGLAFVGTGLGTRHSAVHALTAISSGGFSSTNDSFASFGAGPRLVATVAMVIAGSSYFVMWWLIRGRTTQVWKSTELRLYLAIIATGSVLVWFGSDGWSVGDSIFTAASAASTTGFAVGDWTVLDDAVLAVLLVIIATGSMAASAGGGLHIARASLLVSFASRELRRQLDPHAAVVLKTGGRAIDDRAIERTTGYQIAHLAICGTAAFLLALAGVDLVGAIYTGISTVSTHGPGVGVGPYGSLEGFSGAARLMLIPFMLAGRLSVLPLLLGVAWILSAKATIDRRVRRALAGRRR